MKQNIVPFFAAPDDLKIILRAVNDETPLSFVKCGLFDSTNVQRTDDPCSLEQNSSYLLVPCDRIIAVEEVPQRRGGIKFTFHQSNNPDSIHLQTGGLYDPRVLLPGQVGTISASPISQEIFSLFSKTIRKKFEKVKAYHVGPEALKMLDSGCRLTHSVKGASLYDLCR